MCLPLSAMFSPNDPQPLGHAQSIGITCQYTTVPCALASRRRSQPGIGTKWLPSAEMHASQSRLALMPFVLFNGGRMHCPGHDSKRPFWSAGIPMLVLLDLCTFLERGFKTVCTIKVLARSVSCWDEENMRANCPLETPW
jgi:hypothetical protein